MFEIYRYIVVEGVTLCLLMPLVQYILAVLAGDVSVSEMHNNTSPMQARIGALCVHALLHI